MLKSLRVALAAIIATAGAIVVAPNATAAPLDVYSTPGQHTVNGREWRTTCELYSVTQRCRTEIKATVIQHTNGRFRVVNGWAFNNLTYLASPRSNWTTNPLAANGVVGGKVSWTAQDGRRWRTECDTPLTGQNGCRSFIRASVIERSGAGYRWVTKEILNNMVRFGAPTHAFSITEHQSFTNPWAMSFLPGTGGVLAITERTGALKLRYNDGVVRQVSGVPAVNSAGNGGFGEVVPSPNFASDKTIYLGWVETSGTGTQAVVGRARLDLTTARLTGLTKIWQQSRQFDGNIHFSNRLAIRGGYLYFASSDRPINSQAQDPASDLGKIFRVPLSSPTSTPERVSMGHRNPLGLAFDADGRLWSSEMGPKGGDEFNLITKGSNYGWPLVSNGAEYTDVDIPDHRPGDGYAAPKVFWNPSVSPGSLMIYQGDLFPNWKGDAFMGALSGQRLVRVDLNGTAAAERENWPMGARIREVEEGPDGAIWLLQDGVGGKLLELRPVGR